MKSSNIRFAASLFFALLFILTGCSGATSGSQPVTNKTPLALPTGTATHTATPTTGTDWTTYHYDNTRSGYVANMSDPSKLTTAWNKQLDGAVYAEPLIVGSHLLVVTENNSFYALDSKTGQEQWHTNVGTPQPQSGLPCGNIDPLGITGTPVYDPQTNLVFAVAETTGPAHILVGVDVSTGQIKVRRSVDVQGMDIKVYQQRAALALSKGMIYIAYGGLDGDCGDYMGRVVASRTDGNGPLLSYQVPTAREGGIWAASGPAINGQGQVFVAVGNGAATSGNWDHTDSILLLSPTLQLQDGFAPSQWQQENANDADLGSMGPLLLPNGLVYADGKGGSGYTLHTNALGGVGGQVQTADVCHAYGGSAAMGSTLIVPCTDGIRQVQIGASGSITVGWHAAQNITGSPVISGHTVYSLDPSGTLYALDVSTGRVRTSVSIPSTPRFNTPTLFTNMVYVGTMNGIVAISAS